MENQAPSPSHYLLSRDELLRLLIHAVKTSGKHYSQKQFKERVELLLQQYQPVSLRPTVAPENSTEISP